MTVRLSFAILPPGGGEIPGAAPLRPAQRRIRVRASQVKTARGHGLQFGYGLLRVAPHAALRGLSRARRGTPFSARRGRPARRARSGTGLEAPQRAVPGDTRRSQRRSAARDGEQASPLVRPLAPAPRLRSGRVPDGSRPPGPALSEPRLPPRPARVRPRAPRAVRCPPPVTSVAEGPPVHVQRVDVTCGGVDRAADQRTVLLDHLPIVAGRVFTEEAYNRAHAFLRTYYREHGYARVVVRKQAALDLQRDLATVTYQTESGPSSFFGETKVSGTKTIDPEIVRRELAYEPGDPFRQSRL